MPTKPLSKVLDILDGMRLALGLSLPAILRALWASPALIFKPAVLSRIGMDAIWVQFGQGGDENSQKMKTELLRDACGTVLDLGAAHAHTAKYLDHSKVTKYIALEPNTFMHALLRANAQAAGFNEEDGTLLILSCGAEDTATILSALDAPVDTIVSILTLCSVPKPQATLGALIMEVLAPGGTLILHEHVLNHDANVARWQKRLKPFWRLVFDGCEIDRATDVWARDLVDDGGSSVWQEAALWEPGMDMADSLLWRQNGRFVKKI
ncbi:hypothetical protein MKEN_01422800 [Mycena kentingensis (nom. inval.)]|nr:hypothetical protein MKEN_01422800 [Mycena kentingensis (nom. inval.)]